MPKAKAIFKQLEVTNAKFGQYKAADNLYLIATKDRKHWRFRFTFNGKESTKGLGSAKKVTIGQARALADEARQLILNGINPIDHEKSKTVGTVPTFGEMADSFIETHRASWKNEKHIAQWVMTLEKYAAPIRKIPINEITVDHLVEILKPIWTTKAETASRLQNRIEKVLDSGRVLMKSRGIQMPDNPARWSGNLALILPKKAGKHEQKHHEALPYKQVPQFIAFLKTERSTTRLALEFLILTATRSGETLNSTWQEINFEEKTWTIPASRMKAKKEHAVPLANRSLEILRELKPQDCKPNEYIFSITKRGKPPSSGTFTMMLRRMEIGDFTPHGFRSAFMDWGSEETDFAREVLEMALAHTIGNKTEAAYRRGNLKK